MATIQGLTTKTDLTHAQRFALVAFFIYRDTRVARRDTLRTLGDLGLLARGTRHVDWDLLPAGEAAARLELERRGFVERSLDA